MIWQNDVRRTVAHWLVWEQCVEKKQRENIGEECGTV